MSLLDKIDTKEDKKIISEEKRKAIEREVTKLREYEKLGFIGDA